MVPHVEHAIAERGTMALQFVQRQDDRRTMAEERQPSGVRPTVTEEARSAEDAVGEVRAAREEERLARGRARGCRACSESLTTGLEEGGRLAAEGGTLEEVAMTLGAAASGR